MDFNNISVEAIFRHPITAGIAGALVGLNFVPGRTVAGRIMNLFGGLCVAVFVGPLMFDWMHIVNSAAMSGLSFLLGMLGMSTADAVIRGIAEAQVGAAINDRIRRAPAPPVVTPPPTTAPPPPGERK